MFPLADDNPRELTPYVNWALMAVCAAVFLFQASLGGRASDVFIYGYGMIPARLLEGAELPSDVRGLPAWATVFSSMFMHDGWLHIGSNMLFLWIFGDNVEDALGHVRYLAFYLVCGVGAALAEAFLDPTSTAPMLGASGAISGVLGAYILLFPRANIRTLIFILLFIWVANIPAWIVLGLWFAGQFAEALFTSADQSGIAVWAHVGGLLAGMALIVVLRRPGFGLWQPARSRAFAAKRQPRPWG